MWNRLSRLSRRMRPGGPGPSHSGQRRSIWSRFSRRPQVNTVNQMQNNANSQSCSNPTFSKPRFPSPKSQPKSSNHDQDFDGGDEYVNSADLNIYGNV